MAAVSWIGIIIPTIAISQTRAIVPRILIVTILALAAIFAGIAARITIAIQWDSPIIAPPVVGNVSHISRIGKQASRAWKQHA
jgi:hypothetical protein